ncbi:phosphatidylinositol-4,5-diphosphate 3-kinase, partial [Reticulomyxa filosa]
TITITLQTKVKVKTKISKQSETNKERKDNESYSSGNNSNNNNNNNNNNITNQQVLEDGFLICTQLVKTGGADQGGLQVGDVMVEFGHYNKSRFPGLKSIAALVRKSPEKDIPVILWRKLEPLDKNSLPVFQKISLKLKPLQSHDVNGGGVLGAVINTYPLPQTRV